MRVPGRARSWAAVVALLLLAAGAATASAATAPTKPSTRAAPPPTSSPTTTTTLVPARWPLPKGAVVAAPLLSVVSFPDSASGFGLISGYENPNGSVPVQLVTSTDGGATWHASNGLLPYADRPLPNQGVVTPQLAFANTTLGFSWDQAQIDVTTDGGRTWKRVPNPPGSSGTLEIGPATLVGSSLWVAYTESCEGTLGCVFHIDSWNPTNGWRKHLAQDTSVAAMTTVASTVDVLLTSPTPPGQPYDRNFVILQYNLKRVVGGWQQSTGTLQCPADSSFVDSMAAMSDTEILAECVGDFQAGWAARSYWLTTDAGATWTLRARDDAPPLEKVGKPPSGESGYLAAAGGRFWVAVARSTLYMSDDEGLDWQTVGVKTLSEGGTGDVVFRGEDGWCVYHGLGLWRTSDGGATWARLGASDVGGLSTHPPVARSSTTTSAPSPTTPPTQAPTTTTSTTLLPGYTPSTGPFSAFAGAWGGHGRGATIEASGTGTAIWRTYRSCSQYPQPCDGPGLPISYFIVTFTLTSISDGMAKGEITSTDAPLVPIGPIALTLVGGDQMTLSTPEIPPSQFIGYFCGPEAVPGSCGA